MRYPEHVHIATPPGVGDTYWCLAKLRPFMDLHGIKRVTLRPQRARLTRALEWPQMVDFVSDCQDFAFMPSPELKRTGFAPVWQGVNCAMWPNAVIDRGEHLSAWLPGVALDLDFKINTPDMPAGQVVIYASSDEVNREWLPQKGPDFWRELIREVGELFGQVPVVIGKGWDQGMRARLQGVEFIDMTGRTSLPQVAGLIERARVVVGVICGMTILANHFKTPCVSIYPKHFRPGFLTAWLKPGTPYLAVPAANAIPVQLAYQAEALARPNAR